MTELKMGVYRHYKGQLYQVLGLAHDANADALWVWDSPSRCTRLVERKVVVYIALELNGAHLGPRLAVRTLADFTAWVHPENGSPCATPSPLECEYEDGAVERFTYLGPELTAEMILDGSS